MPLPRCVLSLSQFIWYLIGESNLLVSLFYFQGQGYPPGSSYGYPPGGPPSGYPPSSYPPGSAPGPRPNWPGYSQGSGPPPPSSSGDAYGRPGWPQPPASYSPRPPYPGGQSGPPTTSAGGSASQPQPYPDQFQVRSLFKLDLNKM